MVVDMKTLDLIACCRPLDAEALADDEAEATARIFKALGDPARVKILNRLARADEPVCGCEFQPELGLSQATVSHHLKVLRDAGRYTRLVDRGWRIYRYTKHDVYGAPERIVTELTRALERPRVL